jgi:hypothetical protein
VHIAFRAARSPKNSEERIGATHVNISKFGRK